MLKLFPHLPFILIGDSGEKAPEIYIVDDPAHRTTGLDPACLIG